LEAALPLVGARVRTAARTFPTVHAERALAEETRFLVAVRDFAGATPAQLRQVPIAWDFMRYLCEG
jgi:hypothetical protein